MPKISALALAVISASLLVGCSRQQPELVGSQSDGVAHNEVLISHMSFIPRVLTIQAGQTVTWKWDDGATPHNVTFTSSNLSLATPSQSVGSFRHTFDLPGVYTYRCTIHNNMLGEIIVK